MLRVGSGTHGRSARASSRPLGHRAAKWVLAACLLLLCLVLEQAPIAASTNPSTGSAGMSAGRAVLVASPPSPSSQLAVTSVSSAIYDIEFEGQWTSAVTPGGVPGGAHFSPLIGGVHNDGVTFFEAGGTASPGIESMAEVGGTSGLRSEVQAAMANVPPSALSVLQDGSTNTGPTGSRTLSLVTVTAVHPQVTLTMMIAPSHDWFVGISGLSLLDNQDSWIASRAVDLFPWDAGTEDGTDFALNPSVATTPQGTITNISGTGRFTSDPIAALTFTRRSIAPTFPETEDGARTVDENVGRGTEFGAPVEATDPDSETLNYSLAGPDADLFGIDAGSGQLRSETVLDRETRSEFSVTVIAMDTFGLTGEIAVTITVSNSDEPGVISLWPAQPRVGMVLSAKLDDPDGGERAVSWRWTKSTDQTIWTGLPGSGSSYTPGSDDVGTYIRARADYADAEGSGKTAEAVSGRMVGDGELAPEITVVELISGLTIPWDIAFVPDGTMLFTERNGKLSSRLTDGTIQTVSADFSDVNSVGEAGLMAIAIDPDFTANRRIYTCQVQTGFEVQVIAWAIDSEYLSATRVNDPLVGGIPAATNHSGCRLLFGPQGYLWIATGDAVTGTVPQDLGSLGGKVLKVNAATGDAAPGNPFGTRIYTYGHRNPQGLAVRPGTNQVWSVEHGPSVDDEINLLVAGGNYGWHPIPGYNQSVPMTDLAQFPDAIEANWSSGDPTLATSGGTFLAGSDWEEWNGRFAVATLRGQSLRIFQFASNGSFVSQVVVPELDGTYGRLRTPLLGPDGALYITTSNGGGSDRILKVVPNRPPEFPSPSSAESVPENSSAATVIATVTATDPDGGPLTYSLSGRDAAYFNIADVRVGQVRANAALDFEATHSYEVVVTVADPYGLTDSVTLTISITNVNEAPVIAGPPIVNYQENSTQAVATYTANDPENDSITWSVAGAGREKFEISDRGQLTFKASPDFEDPADANRDNAYGVTVIASDGEISGSRAVAVRVINLNETPVVGPPAAVSIREGDTREVANFDADDPEKIVVAWSLQGADRNAFVINGDGALRFAVTPNFESPVDAGGDNEYLVTVGASDGPNSDTRTVTITVVNVEEAGTLNLSSQQPRIGIQLTATLDDPDGGVSGRTWSWDQSSDGRTWSEIDGALGNTYTPTDSDLNQILRVRITYSDSHGGGKSAEATSRYRTEVAPATNEDPVFPGNRPGLEIAENTVSGAAVGSPITADDPDNDTLTYTFTAGDTDFFTIDHMTGQIRVGPNAHLDHETRSAYSVTVTANDPSNASSSTTAAIAVTDVNEPPEAANDVASTLEDEMVSINVVANDRDPESATLTVTLRRAPQFGSAQVQQDNSITFDPEADYHGGVTFAYRVSDGVNLTTDASVAVTIQSVNDAPEFAAGSIDRTVAARPVGGTKAGPPVEALDRDGDTLTYRMFGSDAQFFDIDQYTGQIAVAASIPPIELAESEYMVEITATDPSGASARVPVTLTATSDPAPPIRRGGGGGGGGGGRPPPEPELVVPTIDYRLKVLDHRFEIARGNPDLAHNIPELEITFANGQVRTADFLGHYLRTGGRTRWGYPTSEVLILEDGTLTQFYQRGVVDFHNLGNGWIVERRLAWDYVGGGEGGAIDQGVEPDVLNPHPGTPLGPWGHKVSNLSVEGDEVGFADFFAKLGGVEAFGFPKSEARRDRDLIGRLRAPGTTAGFVRQYFQAAVVEFHPQGPGETVKLTLLGDILRGILVPDFAEHPPFARADRLVNDDEFTPYSVPHEI